MRFFDRSIGQYPRWFAHRGGAHEQPENTLPAFERAIREGYVYLELDVHLTSDDQWVVLHDPLLERTTNGRDNVAKLSLQEVRTLDAAYYFAPEAGYPEREKGLTIPTLDEVVDLGSELCFNVDIKFNPVTQGRYSPAKLASMFWQFVCQRELQERLLIASSSFTLARQVRRVSAGKALTSASKPEAWAFLLHSHTALPLLVQPRYAALQVPPDYGALRVVTPRFIELAHQAGVEVHLWTLDDPLEAELYLNMGVDGIMTDAPTAMLALKQRAQQPAREGVGRVSGERP